MYFEWIKLKCDKCDENECETDMRIECTRKEFIEQVYNEEVVLRCPNGHYLDWKSIE